MKQLINYSLIISIFIQLCSCKKNFLDVPTTSSIVADAYLENINQMEELLNGVYVKLSRDFYSGGNGLYSVYPDLISDNCKPRQTTFFVQYSWNQTATEFNNEANNINGLWLFGYQIIRDCNYILENVDRFRSNDQVKADNIKGQALAIRALMHHNLVNVFAQPYSFTSDASHPGIPYITISDRFKPVTIWAVNEVYNEIVSDFTKAIELIPASATTKNFINQIAVKALLSRVYLFKGDYTKSKNLAREVLAVTPIMNRPDYPGKLFATGDIESLFWLPPTQSPYSTLYQGAYYAYLYFVATSDLANIFKEIPTDVRSTWVTLSSGNWKVSKFPTAVFSGFSIPEASYYHTVIRSSEMSLTAAECYAKLGNEDSAKYFLDAIRKRADLTASNSIASGSALLDSIYKERRKELSFEGFRMFDLLRWSRGVNRIDYNAPATPTLSYPNGKAIAPIPVNDVKYYGLKQNPSY